MLRPLMPCHAPPMISAKPIRCVSLCRHSAAHSSMIAGAGDRLSKLLEQESAQWSAHERTLLRALLGLYARHPHRLLNFYGPPGTIKTIPYQTVIHGIDSNQGNNELDLQGKTVFVGFSDLYDPGHPDRFYTVFTGDDGVDLSGVEIAATAFGNLLADSSSNQRMACRPSPYCLHLDSSSARSPIFCLPCLACR